MGYEHRDDSQQMDDRNDPKVPTYLYAYVKCGRKAWHLGKLFDDWEEIDFDRGDYVEHHTFRKLASKCSADDRQLARDYANEFTHGAE